MKMRVFLYAALIATPAVSGASGFDQNGFRKESILVCSPPSGRVTGEVSQSYDMPTFIASLENADRANKGYISVEEANRHRVIQERIHLLDLADDGNVTPKEVAFFIKYRVNETTKRVFDELGLAYTAKISYALAKQELDLPQSKLSEWDKGNKGYLDFRDIYIQRALPYAKALATGAQ